MTDSEPKECVREGKISGNKLAMNLSVQHLLKLPHIVSTEPSNILLIGALTRLYTVN